MGSIIDLHPTNRKPFERGLRAVRKELRKPGTIEGLVERGIIEIVPIAGMITGYKYRNVFSDHTWFHTWATPGGIYCYDMTEYYPNDKVGDRRKDMFYRFRHPESLGDQVACRQALEYLLEYLEDDANVRELASIGPCMLHLGWDGESAVEAHDGPSVMVSNYLPWAIPNNDWSVTRSEGGLWYHS